MKYELLLFDADDTLFDFSLCEETALQMVFDHHHIPYQQERHLQLYKEINAKLWKEYEQGIIDNNALKIERFSRLLNQLEVDATAEQFSAVYLNSLAQQSFLIPEAEALLSTLYGKYKMAIITNGLKEVQRGRFAKSSIQHYFEQIIISEEVGHPKPNAAIFEHTFKVMEHADKETTMIIGDNLHSDIVGGNRFGIHSCWYNGKGSVNETAIQPTFEIQNLKELYTILNK